MTPKMVRTSSEDPKHIGVGILLVAVKDYLKKKWHNKAGVRCRAMKVQ